jgi:hypothetical protein
MSTGSRVPRVPSRRSPSLPQPGRAYSVAYSRPGGRVRTHGNGVTTSRLVTFSSNSPMSQLPSAPRPNPNRGAATANLLPSAYHSGTRTTIHAYHGAAERGPHVATWCTAHAPPRAATNNTRAGPVSSMKLV